MLGMKLWFLYVTTHLPSKKMYMGVHASVEHNFGELDCKDKFVGGGDKIIALIKETKAKRDDFVIQILYMGDEAEARKRFRNIKIDYTHPLVLNMPDSGTPLGSTLSEEHKAAIAAATAKALVGNNNAAGKLTLGLKGIKWFNNGTEEKVLAVNEDNTPKDPLYASWTRGKLKKTRNINKSQ